jgi:hypothetical protein
MQFSQARFSDRAGANTDQCGLQLGSVIEEVTLNSCVVGKPEVIRFISHAAQWCRFFRCSLAVSNFRPRSA